MSGRDNAVEREARRLYENLHTSREARVVSSDKRFTNDVVVRLKQMLAGDLSPRRENADD